MKKTNILIILILVIFVTTGWILFSYRENLLFFVGNESQEENIKEKVSLVINNGQESSQVLDAEFQNGMTAFSLLEYGTNRLNFMLKTKNYDVGIFVEAIGNKENGQEGNYWLYYVNGEMPQVSADKKELNAGDKVEFKFEKSPF